MICIPRQRGAVPVHSSPELLPSPTQVLNLSPPVIPKPGSHIYKAVAPNNWFPINPDEYSIWAWAGACNLVQEIGSE